MKNEMVKMYTSLALFLNVCFFILSFWHYEGFSWNQYPALIIVWAVCNIWLVLVIYANLVNRTHKKEVSVKNREFKMYDLKNQ